MKSLLWLIVIFVLAACVAMLGLHNDGYVVVVVGGYRLQASFNLLVVFIIGLVLVLGVLSRIIRAVFNIPGSIGGHFSRQRRNEAERLMAEASLHNIAGNFPKAYIAAEKSFKNSRHKAVVALIAARSANSMRDIDKRDKWMLEAKKFDGENHFARLVSEAEFALESRDLDKASSIIAQLNETGTRNILVQRLALRVAKDKQDWEQLLTITRHLRKRRAISNEVSKLTIVKAHLARLKQLSDNGEHQAVAGYWESIPAEESSDNSFLVKAAPILASSGHGSMLNKLIVKRLQKHWDTELVGVYGLGLEKDELATSITRGEKWLEQHPRDASLLLNLGRMSIDAGLWGKAQSFLEFSLQLETSSKAHVEMARLFTRTEQSEKAREHYQHAALLPASQRL